MLDLCNISPDLEPRKIIRLDEVREMTGLGKTTLYRKMDRDEFPRQIPLGARSVGWYEDEVQDWIRQRKHLRRTSGNSRADLPAANRKKEQPDGANGVPKSPFYTDGTESRQSQRRIGKRRNNEANAGEKGDRGAGPSTLERIGTTSNGREMFWDRSTGNVLIVIGHMSTDWAS